MVQTTKEGAAAQMHENVYDAWPANAMFATLPASGSEGERVVQALLDAARTVGLKLDLPGAVGPTAAAAAQQSLPAASGSQPTDVDARGDAASLRNNAHKAAGKKMLSVEPALKKAMQAGVEQLVLGGEAEDGDFMVTLRERCAFAAMWYGEKYTEEPGGKLRGSPSACDWDEQAAECLKELDKHAVDDALKQALTKPSEAEKLPGWKAQVHQNSLLIVGGKMRDPPMHGHEDLPCRTTLVAQIENIKRVKCA